jgi:DNA-binding response OmpR family regulator
MVTARAEEGDKVLGFEVGADDYVTKPFSTRELIVRVRAVVGRTRPAEADARRYRIKVGDLIVDRRRFEVTVGGRAVGLTPKEFEELVTAVHAARLGRAWRGARPRAKFLAARLPGPAIETVRGVGYRYRESGRPPP